MPEWETVVVVSAVLVVDGERRTIRVRAGVAIDPDTGDRLPAIETVDGRWLIVPPASAARIIGALWTGIRSV